jgi:hypothetical protein
MHPGEQVQVKLPTLSVQTALAPQGLLKHSLTSKTNGIIQSTSGSNKFLEKLIK